MDKLRQRKLFLFENEKKIGWMKNLTLLCIYFLLSTVNLDFLTYLTYEKRDIDHLILGRHVFGKCFCVTIFEDKQVFSQGLCFLPLKARAWEGGKARKQAELLV